MRRYEKAAEVAAVAAAVPGHQGTVRWAQAPAGRRFLVRAAGGRE